MGRFRVGIGGTFGILLLGLMTAAPAAAAGLSADIGSPILSKSRVTVTVPVIVTCPALDPSFDLIIETVQVSIQQAAARQIARGSGYMRGVRTSTSDSLVFVCDGRPHTVVVPVQADPTGPPFHGGVASVTASVEVLAGVESCGPGCGSIFLYQSTTAGPFDRRIS